MVPPAAAEPGSQELRHRILAEATRLFGERGYGSTSVREVAEAVGCTKPALYYWFGSKEGLFLEAVRQHQDTFLAALEAAIATQGTVRERLRATVIAWMDHMVEHRDGMRLLMSAKHRPDKGQPEIHLMSLHQRHGALLQGLLAEGVASGEVRADLDLHDAKLALIGIINMRAICRLEGLPSPDDVPDRVVELFFHGVAP